MAATPLRQRLRRGTFLLLTCAMVLCGCRGRSTKKSSDAASRSKTPPSAVSRERELLLLEQRRESRGVRIEDLTSRDVSLRRAAARALARIADDYAKPLLERALHDEDAEVVVWAAQGLGASCRFNEDLTVRMLVVRAASLVAVELAGAEATAAQSLDPLAAIAAALGRCGTPQAERTLKAWLSGPKRRAEAAARGLGTLASRRKTLDDATLIALLDRAVDATSPLDNALLAFTRVGRLDEAVRKRLFEVARSSLQGSARRRSLAVRALGRSGEAAAPLLESVAVDPKAPSCERADAVRELERLQGGQPALRRVFAELARPATEGKLDLLSSHWGVLSALIETLQPPLENARSLAGALAELPVPQDPAPLRRRTIRLRCRAASLLAEDKMRFDKLALCDPDGAREGKLALLRVLDRGRLTAERYRRWRELVDDQDAVVREAGLRLIAGHSEVVDAAALLADALGSDRAGVVAAAAQVLAARPDRAGLGNTAAAGHEAALRPDSTLIRAFEKALAAERPPDAIATTAALFDAAGSLQLLSAKSRLEQACVGNNPTLREHASRALKVLGQRDVSCLPSAPAAASPPELTRLVSHRATLRFDTDLGELRLELDPALAPVAVTRMVELAEAGFYNGLVIHRVVPGFIVQFGDPQGDGYGSAGRPPLRDEISPRSFDANAVGLALSGPDTGSSQLFVTFGPYPHLDGEYPLLGRASPGWDRVAEGDVIRKVRVERGKAAE